MANPMFTLEKGQLGEAGEKKESKTVMLYYL